jgi:hypothetical protein
MTPANISGGRFCFTDVKGNGNLGLVVLMAINLSNNNEDKYNKRLLE